jgi:hypothetical protein
MHLKQSIFAGLFLLFLPHFASAQRGSARELGFRTNAYNEFNAIYRRPKSGSKNKYDRWRLGLVDFQLSRIHADPIERYLAVGLAYGLEMRKPIVDQLYFVHGPEASVFMGWTRDFRRKSPRNLFVDNGIAFGYALGVQYQFKEPFFLGIETLPGLSIGFSRSLNNDNFNIVEFDGGFISVAVFSFGYRF